MENVEGKNKHHFQHIQTTLSYVTISISKAAVLKFFFVVLLLIFLCPIIWKTIAPYIPFLKRKERDDELSLSQQFELEQQKKRLVAPDEEEEDSDILDEPTLVYARSMPMC